MARHDHRLRSLVRGLGGALLPFLAAGSPGFAASPAPAPAACPLVAFATVRAQAAFDGRTLRLADGRKIRLAGIEVPPAAETGDASAAALTALVAEKDIVLKHLTPATDRYGRVIAWAFPPGDGGAPSIAEALVRHGQARVAIRPGEAGCARTLLAAEAAARAAKLGLWGDPRYELRRAEIPGEVLAARGRYSLVEGRVGSVRESGGVIYVNFGRRWTEDFTVTILKRNERQFSAAGLAPKALQGRRVRVRGVVEERGGPWIEAIRPEQIEVLDGN